VNIKLKVAGRRAPLDMPPDDYVVRCDTAGIKPRGNKILAVLSFTVVTGKYEGVLLTQWYDLPATGVITPTSKYARA